MRLRCIWTEEPHSGDDLAWCLTVLDEHGEEVGGAWVTEDNYDTDSDQCGVLCDEDHPAHPAMVALTEAGWPDPSSAKQGGKNEMSAQK